MRTGAGLTPGTAVACGSLLSACWWEGRASSHDAARKEMPVRAALGTPQFLRSEAWGDPDASIAGIVGLPWMPTGAQCLPVYSRYHT